jgi:hypothetical protein
MRPTHQYVGTQRGVAIVHCGGLMAPHLSCAVWLDQRWGFKGPWNRYSGALGQERFARRKNLIRCAVPAAQGKEVGEGTAQIRVGDSSPPPPPQLQPIPVPASMVAVSSSPPGEWGEPLLSHDWADQPPTPSRATLGTSASLGPA